MAFSFSFPPLPFFTSFLLSPIPFDPDFSGFLDTYITTSPTISPPPIRTLVWKWKFLVCHVGAGARIVTIPRSLEQIATYGNPGTSIRTCFLTFNLRFSFRGSTYSRHCVNIEVRVTCDVAYNITGRQSIAKVFKSPGILNLSMLKYCQTQPWSHRGKLSLILRS